MPDFSEIQAVSFWYTNHRGEERVRRVVPIRIWFGSSPWHGPNLWLLEAFDLDKKQTRAFDLRYVRNWSSPARLAPAPPSGTMGPSSG